MMSGVWMRSRAQIKGSDKACRPGNSSLVHLSQICSQQKVWDKKEVLEGAWTGVQGVCVGPSAGSRRSDDAIKQKSRNSPFVSDCLKSSGETELSSR